MATSGNVTLAEIRLLARQRANQEKSLFISDAEFTAYVNGSAAELYDLLAQKYGDDYFVADPFTIVADGVIDRFALPAGFYKLLGVDQVCGAGQIELRPFRMAERNRAWAEIEPGAPAALRPIYRYRLTGRRIWFRPIPRAGQAFTIYYVPRPTPLVNDTDTLDGVSGWEEYVVVDAARKALQKEESDATHLEREKAALVARIESAAENRDASAPARVVDVYEQGIGPPVGTQGVLGAAGDELDPLETELEGQLGG